jgi:hypothetical protein
VQNHGRTQAEGRRHQHARPSEERRYLPFPMVISAVGRDESQPVRALKAAYDGSDVARVKVKRPYKALRVALEVRGPSTRGVRHSRGKSGLAN